MKIKFVLTFFFFLSLVNETHAQNYINLLIKDSISSEILIGATVLEEGTSNGGATDISGKVKFPVSKIGPVTFKVQLLGYNSKTVLIPIPQKETITLIVLSSTNAELNEVTISSVRTNSHIEDIPTRVEVLGLEDLEEENGIKPGNIISLLGDIAGIQIQQVSASSGNSLARIQGLNGRYTQLLKDGLPLFGGLSGSFGILQIPPLDLKQIEIIKGSVSTLYGGDAIGGIINLISKEPKPEREWTVTLNQSTFGESNINQYYAKRFKKTGITFFAGQTSQKQNDIDKDGLSDVPNISNTVIHPKFIFYFNPRSNLSLNYTGTFENRKGGDMNYLTSPKNDTLYHITNKMARHNSSAKWEYIFSENKNLSVVFSNSLLDEDLKTKHYNFKAQQLIYYSEISYRKSGLTADWVSGINFNGDNFNNKTLLLTEIKDYNYSTIGGFIQNTWRPIKKLTLESGLRVDHHSEFGYIALPRLSLMYKFSSKINTRLNGGYGYKAPNIIAYADAETELNKIVSGRKLDLELSEGVNGDINYTNIFFKKLGVTLNQSFFFTNLKKPVFDSPSADSSGVVYQNADKSIQTKGLQTYARLKYDEFEIYLGYVYTNVKKLYDTKNSMLPVTPQHNFSTTLFYELSRWRFGIESAYIAGQVDEKYLPVRNYLTFAAMIQYNLKKLTFVLNCENVNDFRQSKYEKIYSGTIYNPEFHKLWAPIDGRVVNFSVKWDI